MGNDQDSDVPALGRIQLKQVKVSRAARSGAANQSKTVSGDNPMNRLVPYLDLFCRLDDEGLARLCAVDVAVVADLRKQVDEIGRALSSYLDLVDRLSEEEFVRLTGASVKTIRFWKLCQPRKNGEDSAASSSAGMRRQQVAPTMSPAEESSPFMDRDLLTAEPEAQSGGRAAVAPTKSPVQDDVGIPADDDDDDFALTFQE